MKETKRLDFLDSIRGLAAVTVMLSHCWLSNPDNFSGFDVSISNALASPGNAALYVAMKFFNAGRSAVMIFFVLSGFVLAFSLLKQPVGYAAYAVKRFLRIYAAFLFVILLTYALHYFIGYTHPANSAFLRENDEARLTFSVLMEHLLMAGTQGSRDLSYVAWSLYHEMRISLVFPLILFAVRKWGARAVLSFLAVSAGCTFWLVASGARERGIVEDTFLQSLAASGGFLVFFAAGAWLAVNREKVAAFIKKLPKAALVLFGAAVACCLLKGHYGDDSFKSALVDYGYGAGAAGLIALALGLEDVQNILHHKIMTWLGRISYSLYLIHLPILYAVTQTIGSSWSVAQISLAMIALSLPASELMVRFIELPSIRLGKAAARRIGGKQAG